MSTYKNIRGKAIKSVSTNLSDTGAEGQIWFNTTDNTFKSVVAGGAFSTGSPTINAFGYGGWSNQGTQNATLITGHPGTPNPAPQGKGSDEYNGTGWTSGGNLNNGRSSIGSCGGTLTSCIITSGSPGSGLPAPTYNFAESYNGTSFTTETAFGTARGSTAGGGASETAAIAATGDFGPPGVSNATESWNGSSWTSLNSAPTATRNAGSTGVLTSLLVMGGTNNSTTLNFTAEYDGSSWTAGTNYPAANRGSNGAGSSSTAALIIGGNNGSGTAYTEAYEYDGTTYTDIATILTPQMNNAGSSGSTTAAIFCGFSGGTPTANLTHELNKASTVITGATWSTGNNMNSARARAGGMLGSDSTQSASMAFGGQDSTGVVALNEEYDGTSWTESGDLGTARRWTY